MSEDLWLDILSRIAPSEPVDLDALLPDRAPRPDPGPVEPRGRVGGFPVSARLWDRDPEQACIGIRVSEPPADLPRLALRLASAAAERGVVPIILSALPTTGFERFGFRVERLPEGASPDELTRAETEIQRFWDMPIVIDLKDVAHLG